MKVRSWPETLGTALCLFVPSFAFAGVAQRRQVVDIYGSKQNHTEHTHEHTIGNWGEGCWATCV